MLQASRNNTRSLTGEVDLCLALGHWISQSNRLTFLSLPVEGDGTNLLSNLALSSLSCPESSQRHNVFYMLEVLLTCG